jgi:hypothetical protein
VGELIAALAGLSFRRQQTVQGADRAAVDAFIEQRAVDLGGGAVLKTLGV